VNFGDVGMETADDSGVSKVSEELAIIQTGGSGLV
jgi:hypothetical protein